MKKILIPFFAVLSAILSLSSCSKVGLKHLAFSSDSMVITLGQWGLAPVVTDPEGFDTFLLEWSSSDENVAVVSGGYITPIAEGETVIRASYGRLSASIHVQVQRVEVTQFTVPGTIELAPGYSKSFEVTNIAPSYATAANLVFTPGTNDKLTISIDGNLVTVTASSSMKKGDSGKLTVSSASGSLKKDIIMSYVYRPVTGLTISKSSLSMSPGQTAKVTATVTPSNATDGSQVWTVDNEKIISYDSSSSTLTALSQGTATLTVKAGTLTAKCAVTVTGYPISGKAIMLSGAANAQKLSLGSGIEANWSVNSTNIAKIASDGTLTGLSSGWVTVTATYAGGSSQMTVRVVNKDFKPAFYAKYESSSYRDINNNVVYSLKGNLTGLKVLPSYGPATIYVGSDDGYSLSYSELKELFGSGKSFTISRTGDAMHDAAMLAGVPYSVYNSYIGSSLTGSTYDTVTAPNGQSATFTWTKSLTHITMKSSSGSTQTVANGGKFTISSTCDLRFYLNPGSNYSEEINNGCGPSKQLTAVSKYTLVCDNGSLEPDFYDNLSITSAVAKGTYNFHIQEYPSVKFSIEYK